MSRSIYWFRNDLRIADNEPFTQAAINSKEVLPVYILDKSWLEEDQFGVEKIGAHRLKFLLESLLDLKQQLQNIGSDLYFAIGDPIEELNELRRQHHCGKLYAQKSCAYDEQLQETAIANWMVCEFTWGDTLYHLDDLPFDLAELPGVFTQFRKQVEKKSTIRKETETPLHINSPEGFGTDIPDMKSLDFDIPQPDERSVLHFTGGATAAKSRLQYYLWDKELLSSYKKTRNGLIGGDYSSKFSPWLAHGCLSARQIYWQVKRYEKYIQKNSSTYWLIFELIWRDYFHFVAKKYGAKLFQRSGITGEEKVDWGPDKLFHLWTSGRTKEPFVDANMREMNSTGFMSNRGRQNVASYLIHNMKIDWRLGAAYFEKMLIDDDPCSNYGNWIYIAGVGNDPQGGREFDLERQKAMYDPKGEYQALWA